MLEQSRPEAMLEAKKIYKVNPHKVLRAIICIQLYILFILYYAGTDIISRPDQTDNDTTLSQLLDGPATFLSNDRQEQRDKRLQAVAKQKVWVE